MSRTSAQVRAELAAVLPLDLVGPSPGHELENETLSQAPSRWYLTGFLVPYEASEAQKTDATAQEEIAQASAPGGVDDNDAPEQASARKVFFPSSMGLSVLVPNEATELDVDVTWGDYAPVRDSQPPDAAEKDESRPREWKRTQRVESLVIQLKQGRYEREVPNSQGLKLVAVTRRVAARKFNLVPKGTLAVAVFLVNHREPADDLSIDQSFAFQAALALTSAAGFCPRPNMRGLETTDWDEQVADVQYRDVFEYAVGHGVATRAQTTSGGKCHRVESTWMPTAQVEKVVPGEVQDLERRMEALAEAATPEAMRVMLTPLVARYADWVGAQHADVAQLEPAERKQVALELLRRADVVRKRIAAGIDTICTNLHAFEAFRITNRTMAKQARQRDPEYDKQGEAPSWRPFQLAFLLLNVNGMATPEHADRETVDLLFFPTGGGKTEAYLGLAAFTLVLRRLTHPGLSSAGVTVLMRYTLRLLTLDQLSRAATLICALELEREKDVEKLGAWPFEIGLWVGQAATPNRMGRKGDKDRHSARARTIAFHGDDRKPSPIPLENCPWCNYKFTRNSFSLRAAGREDSDHPTQLRVQCASRRCDFSGAKGRTLPLLAVDESIYRRLPSFLIATVDKFASLPWVGQVGALFGKVDRHDAEGFYGPADPGCGRPLDAGLLPPDLIIQDELHLISGPLGTMVGLYETALDALATRGDKAKPVRPKVVASTATVRRAERQIHALFARNEVEVFPPPGPDLRDSFFAQTVRVADVENPAEGTRNARMYLGIAAQGRSLKVVLLRTYLALLAAAQRAYKREGGAKNPKNPADSYMTLLGYFNSLRELGGSRRIVEDEVRSKLSGYARRVRTGDPHPPFSDREIDYIVSELTSRENTAKVADTKRRLALSFGQDDDVDVALATNMISVGLDITRLGLMVVLGQPKTASEYIQATSRVGRDDKRPGLVVTLLNVHKPRDRSHYERFEAFHEAFYRAVEATSVTPFAERAVDRGLAAVAVGLARHHLPLLTAPRSAIAITQVRTQLGFVVDALGARAVAHDRDMEPDQAQELRLRMSRRVEDLLDDWKKIADRQSEVGAGLQYQREEGGAPPLLYDPLDPELLKQPREAQKFKAQRSLRDVEPSVNLWVRNLDGADVEFEEDDV